MISQRIRAFILVFLASVNFYAKAYSDDSDTKKFLKEPINKNIPKLHISYLPKNYLLDKNFKLHKYSIKVAL